ncbi:MAG: hypothetical protein K0U69_07755 [Actinomycetia bacterium]|nr:hypothetical protein [Actinomycetes bacterium]
MTMGTADLAPDVSPDDAEIRWTDSGRPFVRTPDECFVDLPYYPWAPNYAEVDRMRMHYVEAGVGSRIPVHIAVFRLASLRFVSPRFMGSLSQQLFHFLAAP